MMEIKATTLCYLKRNNKTLLLHRIKKQNDENAGKWIGVGGKLEDGESPDDCVVREVREETGLVLNSCFFRGIITFVSDEWGTEYMFLFTSEDFSGEVSECDEGVLRFVPDNEISKLPMWEGDRIFLRLLEERDGFFSLKLCYTGDVLTSAFLDGEQLDIKNGK